MKLNNRFIFGILSLVLAAVIAFDKGRQSTFSVIRLNQEIKTVAGVAGFFSAPVLSIGKTIVRFSPCYPPTPRTRRL